MSDDDKKATTAASNADLPVITITSARVKIDMATVLGVTFALGLVVAAIIMGQSNANFFNVPSLMIVLLGTMAATAVSYTPEEIKRAGHIFFKSIVRRVHNPSSLTNALISLAVASKMKGVLSLTHYDKELKKNDFLHNAIQMVVDGFSPQDVEILLNEEIDALIERHKRSASIAKRASEVAPAMGLIGTLVGLVQMLAELENPETIGPAMAVALLTTFYGAILGTVVMGPLSIKLEKNSHDEALIKTLITIAATSIAKQDNPRRLEMQLNAELSPGQRVQFFD